LKQHDPARQNFSVSVFQLSLFFFPAQTSPCRFLGTKCEAERRLAASSRLASFEIFLRSAVFSFSYRASRLFNSIVRVAMNQLCA